MKRILPLLLVSALFAGCKTTLNYSKVVQQGDLYYFQKDYQSAFEEYSKVIELYMSKGQVVPGEVYSSAGKSLYYSNNQNQAMEYFQRAENVGDIQEETLLLRIHYFESIDNLSKEVDCLEKYTALFSSGAESSYVYKRLFLRYFEMGEWRKAHLKFSHISDYDKDDINILEKYFKVCEKLEYKTEADKTARLIYDLNPNNLIGLNFVAYDAYITTENEYVAAIKAYEAKKTQAAYKLMQQKTAPLAARFRTAKAHYVKLYNLYKRPHDAAILSRICTRLNDKTNAAYYDRLSKK